jgi:hypothetical protein
MLVPRWYDYGRVIDSVSDDYGRSVVISDDGQVMVVAAPEGILKGTVLAYRHDDEKNEWGPATVIGSGNLPGDNHFGRIIEISGDGSTVAMVADTNIYVTKYNGTQWMISYFFAANNVAAISLSHDGEFLVYTEMNGPSYVVNKNELDVVMSRQIEIPPPTNKETGDISISGDGSVIAILTEFTDGSRYVKTYSHPALLETDTIDYIRGPCGSKVDLNADGTRMAVGLVFYPDTDGNGIPDRPSLEIRIYDFVNDTWSQYGSTISDFPFVATGLEVVIDNSGDRVGVYYYTPESSVPGEDEVFSSFARVYEINDDFEWIRLGTEIGHNSLLTSAKKERMFDMAGDERIYALGVPANNLAASYIYGVPDALRRNLYWQTVLGGIC